MTAVDWAIVAFYSLASLLLGVALTRKASQGIESYFVSNRRLAWWLAGTSMAATSFSSDTPLLITGIVRQKGIWGNWEVWALAISTMFAVFFFSRLWKRSGVITEVEFVELRYGGKSAAALRGFKALYWGVFYNMFVMGAWPMTGLVKVMQETTDWTKTQAIFFCMTLTVIYSSLSGFWGVVLTDFFQFFIAMAGALILAYYAIQACGGVEAMVSALENTDKLAFIPPVTGTTGAEILASPFVWFLGMIFFQWWAWKNSDGGGIIVQRIASCKNERQAILATLWFNIAHYALRAWPWILTALASLVLLPGLTDHERAYPRLVATLLPEGLRGLMVASFFAAFMSTMSTHLNWGSSYFVHDFYKRFIRRDATEAHYVKVGRIAPFFLAAGATWIAFHTESISQVFTFILNLTAAIGPVYFLRWFWWRIHAGSEIAAMAASLPIILIRPFVFESLGIPPSPFLNLIFMITASAAVWLPVTFLAKPESPQTLEKFYSLVRPPGFWKDAKTRPADAWWPTLWIWLAATAALLLTAIGPLKWILGDIKSGVIFCSAAVLLWGYTARQLNRQTA